MRPLGVVVDAPALDQHAGFGQGIEDLAVEQLVAQLAIEALVGAVLPGAGPLDVQRAHTKPAQPCPHDRSDELRPLVRADVLRRTARDEQLGQRRQHVVARQPPRHHDRQALPRERVDHRQHAELPPVMGAVLDEVVGPDMVRPLRPQPDAGLIRQPQPAPFRLTLRHLQPLPTPDPLHPLGVHQPARAAQQRRDPAVAIATEAARQRDDLRRQRRLVLRRPRRLALGRTVLPEHSAGAALGHAKRRRDVPDAGPAAGGAQEFPDAASFRISLSSVSSATAKRCRAFSRSSSFSRRAWSIFRPPYSRRQRS